jgi:hypothetical protein
MAIHATCPVCRASSNLADTLAGKTVRCKQCNRPFTARETSPDGEAIAPTPAARSGADREDRRDERRRDEPRRRRRDDDEDDRDVRRRESSGAPVALFVVLGGGALVVVGLIVVIVVFVFMGSWSSSSWARTRPARSRSPPHHRTPSPIPSRAGHRTEVLSADGAYLAARSMSEQDKPSVLVWSVATGALLRTIEVDRDPKMRIGRLDFAGKDRLLTAKHVGDFPHPVEKTTYQMWNIQTGQEVAHFDVNLVFDPRWAGISPGGRFLVLEDTAHGHYFMRFYDLTTGQLAARFNFQGRKEPWGQATGIAFSRDGKEVAMLWRYGRGQTWGRLFCWDLTTGKKVRDYKIGQVQQTIDYLWTDGDFHSFQWLPDGKAWLLAERLVIDRDTGNYLGDIEPTRGDSRQGQFRRFLDKDHFCIKVSSRTGPQLRVVQFPGARPAR